MSVWESTISLIIIIINVFSAINYIVYKGNKRGGGGKNFRINLSLYKRTRLRAGP